MRAMTDTVNRRNGWTLTGGRPRHDARCRTRSCRSRTTAIETLNSPLLDCGIGHLDAEAAWSRTNTGIDKLILRARAGEQSTDLEVQKV